MSTPNIEELRKLAEATAPEIREWFVLDAKGWCIAGEGYDAQEYIAAANPAKVLELLDKMQSQAARIKELERESETHAKAYGLAIVERDNLRHELKVAQEGWRCECSTDDACRFARERDALRAQLDAIAATEPVLVVEKEPDYWSGGHFHEGSKPHVKPTKVWSLPIGTPLFTRPMPAESKDAERYRWLAGYLISMDTSKDDYIVSCASVDEMSALIDAQKGAK